MEPKPSNLNGFKILRNSRDKECMKNLLWFYNIFHVKTIFYVEGLRVNLLSMSQICDQDFMVLSSKGKCFVMDESGKKLISGV